MAQNSKTRGLKPGERDRFLPIDAMRGIAALSVLLFHLLRSSAQTGVLDRTFPGPLKLVSDYGRNGVAVFFVISGFVIAYTTRNLGTRPRDGVRFSIRRQVRLDPPYYAVLIVVLAFSVVKRLIPGLVYQHYTLGQVVLNMFYLQGFAGVPSILAVAWTLCLEVQFYLFVTLLVITSGVVVRTAVPARQHQIVRAGSLMAGGISLALPFLGIDSGPWFIGLWWMFCFGMVTCWFMTGQFSRRAALAVAGILAAWLLATELLHPRGTDPWHGGWIALLTGSVILALVLTKTMNRTPPRFLLFFGAISYSLYLVHVPVIDTVMAVGYKLTGDSRAGAVGFYILGAVTSVALAVGLRLLVERPSMRLSARLKTIRRPTTTTALLQPDGVPRPWWQV